MSQYTSNWAREHAFKAECVEAGRECLSAREAALLFGVEPATLRMAKKAGNIRPVFVMTFGRGDIPFYRLSDLINHFHRTGSPELLDKMRRNGNTCWMQSVSPGGWLLLSDRPGLRPWDDDEEAS